MDTNLDMRVREYLKRLRKEKCIYVPDPNHGLDKQINVLDYNNSIGCALLPN